MSMTVEQALALLNTLTHECGGNRDINALATLRAELDGLRADAERYRWLRPINNTAAGDIVSANSDERLDATIDAARQEKGHE